MNSSIREKPQIKIEEWSPVETTNFSPRKLKKFKQRKRALDLYLSSQYSLNQISEMTSLSVSEIKRILKRALMISEDGSVFGYLACIPNLNLRGYKRNNTISHVGGGLFTLFLEKNPTIKEKLDSWALGRSSTTHVAVRGRYYKRIYNSFKQLCIDNDIDINTEYPFTNSDMGMGAIRRYCIKLKKEHFVQAAKVDFGDFSGKLCINSVRYSTTREPIRPYDIVQLDGHKIDSEISVKLIDEFGDIQYLPLSRIWLLTLIDSASRVVLGYSISLSENYTSEDVLACIASALVLEDILPGLPSAQIEGCRGRLFNCIKFDNAYSQTSSWLQEKLIEIGIQEVITNRAGRPRSNPIVERFFETLEEKSFHQFPTTTGSHHKDPRRRKPQKTACELAIYLDDIETTLQHTIDWYNHSPHSSLNGRSPLEYLSYCMEQQSDLIRSLKNSEISIEALYRRQYQVTIRGNKAQGHPPYIQFKNVRYSSAGLMKSPQLIGAKAIFETDIRDIRKGKLFMSEGKFIDEISANKQWSEHKHSLRDRKAISKLARNKQINFEFCSPLVKYTDFLAEKSLISRRERNEYIRVNRELDKTNAIQKIRLKRTEILSERAISLSRIFNTR